MQVHGSLEAGLEFTDPGKDFKLAPFKSYGLVSGRLCFKVTADAVS